MVNKTKLKREQPSDSNKAQKVLVKNGEEESSKSDVVKKLSDSPE